MNINKKFRTGELNAKVYDLITTRLLEIDSSDHLTHFFIQNKLLAFSLSINFFSIFSMKSPQEGPLSFFIVIISGLLAIFFFVGSVYGFVQNWRFGRYYNKFIYHADLSSLGMKCVVDLGDRVFRRLKSLAKELEYFEKECGKMSPVVSDVRKKLSEAHAFFLKLGLCKEDWGIYFDKTENTEK